MMYPFCTWKRQILFDQLPSFLHWPGRTPPQRCTFRDSVTIVAALRLLPYLATTLPSLRRSRLTYLSVWTFGSYRSYTSPRCERKLPLSWISSIYPHVAESHRNMCSVTIHAIRSVCLALIVPVHTNFPMIVWSAARYVLRQCPYCCTRKSDT